MATVFAPVRTRHTFEEAVEQLADAIRGGDLVSGEALPSERTLAAQMDISRRTVREAIRVLLQAGVVEARPGPRGGMVVRSEAIPADITQRSQLRINEVSHVLEARRLFEPQVAQLAAIYGEPDDFEALQRTIDLQRQHLDDHQRFLALDTRFHVGIARATGNATVVEMMKGLLEKIEIARDMAARGASDSESAIDIHVRTLAALRARRPAEIDAVMDEHMRYLEERWQAEGGRLRYLTPPAFSVRAG